MCRLPKRFCVLAGALLALNGAGVVWIRARIVSTPNPRLRVLRALPERGVDDADRFSLIFDEKLAGKDELARPLPESPFVVRPEPDGHWQWAKPDRLDFVLNKRLPAGRVYRVLPAPSFERLTGRSLVGKSAFTFRTRPLRVVSCRLQSFDNSNATFEIVFNQKVHPADVVKHIRVGRRSAGAPRYPVALVKEPAESVVLRVERRGSEHLRVELDGRLAGHGGELPLGRPYVETLYVAPAFALLGANAYASPLGTNARVTLRFSTDLDCSQKLPEVEVTPHVENVRVSRRYMSLVLEGPFESGASYTARVVGNLLSHDGQVLGPRETVSFTVPDRQPALRFKHTRGILMPEGNLALEVEMVNVPGVHVSASRVHAENIVAHVRGAHTGATSRRLLKRTFTLDLPRNKPGVVAVDLGRLVDRPLGVYWLEARSTSCRWRRRSAVVTVTDLGITAKRGKGGFLVWVSSLKTGRPVQGARVSAFTYNNKRLAESTTGPDGTATLEVPPKHPDGPAWLIVAQRGDDMNYLRPDARRWVIEGVDQGGRAAPETYDVMLYTERGVYRPGDVVHVTGVVRDADGGVPPAFPVAIKVTRPDGRPAAELTTRPEAAQGVFHAELRTREGFQTGRYRFDAALPGSEEVLGSTHAMVEAFVPVRIEVSAATTKERYLPEDDPELECEARYLFGRPAAELALSVEGEYRRVEFKSKRHPGFSFRPVALGKRVKLPAQKLKLDGDGAAKVAFASTRPKEPGLWRALLSATVTETGGRSVSANASALVDSAGRHVGLRKGGDRFVRAGRPVPFEWAVVTGKDEPVTAGEVELSLHRVDYDYIWQEVNGRRIWKHSERLHQVFKRVSDAKVADGGVGGAEFACPSPGRYRLKALDRRTGNLTQLEFYASDPAYGSARAETARPERLEILLDRKSYAPGSKAKALVRSPFPGTMLFTVESDRVIARRVVVLKGGSAEVVFD
ncbi:MAG: MG2 domain-containing protein, partial [Planctomycetota bacterium]